MKVTKEIRRSLKAVADRMDRVYLEKYGRKDCFMSIEIIKVLGSDLILAGTDKVAEKPIDPKLDYLQKSPVYLEINNHRRLCRAYKANGSEGVKKYIRDFNNKLKAQSDE